jgi:hypothetical protein
MYVVPNHMLEQFGRAFMQLYPGAKLLMAGKEDFTRQRRKLLTAKMASGAWDGILVTHSSFERIGLSHVFQERFVREQIAAYDELLNQWEAHPSRADQTIAFVRGVEPMWSECDVSLNACVIRFWNKKKKRTDHIVWVTTDQKLNAPWIVRHDEERPEIEQDDQQMKSGGWQLNKLSTTRYSEIVFYILTVVLSYSLYHLFANTQAGARFADKTRQAVAF